MIERYGASAVLPVADGPARVPAPAAAAAKPEIRNQNLTPNLNPNQT
jgi:hypothetical protein